MMDEPEDLPEALHDAHRAANNSAVLLLITLIFGVIALGQLENVPTWLTSVWFLLVIPLNLYLTFMNRHRYHVLREMHHESGSQPDD